MDKKELKRNIYSFILGVSIGNAILIGTRKLDCGNKFKIEFNIVDKSILLDNNIKIDEYLGQKVSFEEVRNTVRNNANLNEIDKNKIVSIIGKLEEKVPYIDLRCFNLNCKNLKIIRQDIEEENVAGLYNSKDDLIILESENNVVFNHEILHLLNSLDQIVNNNEIIKNYSCNNKNLSYQTEAFTEWFNSYLFGYPPSSYQTEISNLNIMKKILNVSDVDLIKTFVNNDYKQFALVLENFNNGFKDVNYILEKYKNDKVPLSQEKVEKITNTYIDSYIKVNGKKITDDLYQFIDVLCKNYVLNCNSSYNNQIEFKNNILKRVSETLKIKQPIIYDCLDKKEQYLDINNLYLICSNDEHDNKSYLLAEKYRDEEGNDVFITNLQKIYVNLSVYDCNYRETSYKICTNMLGEEDQICVNDYVAVKQLLACNTEISLNQIIENYEDYKQQPKIKKYKKSVAEQ